MSSRRIEDLHPAVQTKCRFLIEMCRERGINLIITSTLRTEAEQLAYFAQGRKSLKAVNEFRARTGLPPITIQENKRIITKNLTSIHQFCCAFDVAIVKEGTTIWEIKADVNKNQIPDYEEIGKIGEAIGLRWGGRWGDYVHFEYTGGLTVEELEMGKRPDEQTEEHRA